MMKRLSIALLAFIALPAHAQSNPCPLPEPWTSWPQSGTAIAGASPAAAPRLILGKPVTATLRPMAQLQLAVPPGKATPKSYGGLFTLAIKVPARVGIALSDGAWVDAATGRTALKSVDHGYGPACSDIRKIVWFDLPKGLHLIQIASAAKPAIRIMAADAKANQPQPPAPASPF